MPTKTEAIQRFLNHVTHPDLSALYNSNMECQVNVAQDGGERIEGDYKGRKWHGWTDGLTTWKALRIPVGANTESPTFVDSEIKWDISAHAEGIGMTGWDWVNKVSRWVAFDFDAITGHSDKHKKKLTPEELEAVRAAACELEWVTVRKSTSGKGLHLYIFLDPPVPTSNHTEHAALARSILGTLSAVTGFDFGTKVDACGGNMWVWHRKMKDTDGLTLVKRGEPFSSVPYNWRDHIPVVTNKTRRNKPQFVESDGDDFFEELCGQSPRIPLDEEHKRLINYFQENDCMWWWDQDRHMLVCHTSDLKAAHTDLAYKGIFETISEGKEKGVDQNCFCFPLRRGAWAIRRHTRGVQEASTWDQDGSGWTRCFYNQEPDLKAACRAFGGVEDPDKGGFVFQESEMAVRAAAALGTTINIPARYTKRRAILRMHKDNRRLVCEFNKEPNDTSPDPSWLVNKKDQFVKIFDTQMTKLSELDTGNYDDIVRHLVTESGEDCGWLIKSEGAWHVEPLAHVKIALEALGMSPKDAKMILGSSVMRCWTLVNRPFQPEYPGNREWNRNAAQLKHTPSNNTETLHYPTWQKILNHCGQGLDEAVRENGWCKANGIIKGADYLKCWIASLFQEPTEPLPYLFFFGPQNSGKSIFHEALDLLMSKGYKRADTALTSQGSFNGELVNSVVCVVEETDLNRNREAYNRIKDWVTSRQISIHPKGGTPYHIVNTTHWIQCSNESTAVPIFPGDTRITMAHVPALDPMDLIPKKQLLLLLEKEAPDFVSEIIHLELPLSNDRLNIPTIVTHEKRQAEERNQTDLQRFLSENYHHVPGESVKLSEFFEAFKAWLDPNETPKWSSIRVGRELPHEYVKGRATWDNNQVYIGNLSKTKCEPRSYRFVLRDGNLVKQ